MGVVSMQRLLEMPEMLVAVVLLVVQVVRIDEEEDEDVGEDVVKHVDVDGVVECVDGGESVGVGDEPKMEDEDEDEDEKGET